MKDHHALPASITLLLVTAKVIYNARVDIGVNIGVPRDSTGLLPSIVVTGLALLNVQVRKIPTLKIYLLNIDYLARNR